MSTITDVNNWWSSGSVGFFPRDPKLTSFSKKSDFFQYLELQVECICTRADLRLLNHTFFHGVSFRPQTLSWFHPRPRGLWIRQAGRFHPNISAQWHSTHLSVRHKPLFLRQNSQTSSYTRSPCPKDTCNFPGLRSKRLSSEFLSTTNPRSQTSLVFRLVMQFRNTQFPYRSNPSPRTSPCCRSTRLRKSVWLP